MRVKLLDTVTGEVKDVDAPQGAFQWAENNWSCDCNRCTYFGLEAEDLGKEDGICFGEERFLVIGVEGPTRDYYTLRDYNRGYPVELLAKYNITDQSPLNGSEVSL